MLHRAGRPRRVPRVGALRGLATSALPTRCVTPLPAPRPHSSSFTEGSRALRVGVLVPSTNTSCEGDWQAVAAQLNAAAGGGRHMTIHGARMFLTNDDMFDDPEGSMLRMNEHIASGAKALSTANVDVVCLRLHDWLLLQGPRLGRGDGGHDRARGRRAGDRHIREQHNGCCHSLQRGR